MTRKNSECGERDCDKKYVLWQWFACALVASISIGVFGGMSYGSRETHQEAIQIELREDVDTLLNFKREFENKYINAIIASSDSVRRDIKELTAYLKSNRGDNK